MTDQPPPTVSVNGKGVSFGEIRGWIVIGLFCLTGYIFYLTSSNPNLENNKLFFALAVAVVSGSFCGVIGYYFGSSKGLGQLNDTAASQAKTIAALSPPPSS